MSSGSMRSTLHGPEVLLLKSKKPHVQALIARSQSLTEAEICALPEKPDVIKALLNIRKLNDQSHAATVAERYADMMTAAHHPNLARQMP